MHKLKDINIILNKTKKAVCKMARNLKPENLKKLSLIKTTNGFKIDLANYMYNPSYNHEYPSFLKITNQTETERFYTRVYYFKYHSGTGKYFVETYSSKIDPNNSWSIASNVKQTELEDNNRFNLKHLIELTEKIESISTIAAR